MKEMQRVVCLDRAYSLLRRAVTNVSEVWRKTVRGRGLAILLPSALLSASIPTIARAQVDLVLNVTDTPDPLPRTGLESYGVVIANNGLTTATGITYTMSVPSNTTYQGFTVGTGASCSGMSIGQAGPGTVTCTHPSLAFNASGSFVVRLRLNAQGTTTVASSVTSTEADADVSNNDVSSTTTVTAGADYSATLTAPASLASGSSFSYVLGVTNAGPDPASLLRVQFTLPAGFTQSGGLPAGCSLSAGVVTCDVSGPVASGASQTIGNISGKITVAAGSTVTGAATISLQPGAPATTPQDPNTSNNTTVASINVTAGSDVRISVSRSVAGPYFIGNSFNFVLTAAYDGDTPNSLTITDVLPGNYTIGAVAPTQSGWACSVSGQTVTCTRASGGAAGSNQSLGTITIPVTIASAGSGVVNTATITAASPLDPDNSNNSATDGGATLQAPTADLAIAMSGPNPALAVLNVPFNWTLTASNTGPSAFFGQLVITDDIPSGVTISSYTLNGWSCSPATPVIGPATITCSRTVASGSPLASGASAPSLVFTAMATSAGVLTNSAVLSSVTPNVADPNLANNSITSAVTASTGPASADLSVLKRVDLATVPAGDVLTYTLEVVNAGPATSTSITLTDVLSSLINNGAGPTGQGYVSETVTLVGLASAVNCSNAASGAGSRTLTCTIPSLPPCVAGTNCPTIDVAIRPGGNGGTRSNSATAISSVVADSNTTNNTGSVSSTIDPRADVTVTKTASPTTVAAGQNLTYVVTARNNGPSQAANVTIDDVLPLNVFFVSALPSAGSCSVKPTANTVTAVGNRNVTCNLGTIANGAQRTVTIVVRPTTSTRGTTLTNNVDVSTTTVETTPPGATNNSASVDVTVSNPSLDLLVNKTDSVDPVAVGSSTVYTITITNSGPSDAENVVVTDTMPPVGLSFQSHTISSGSCSTVPAVNSVGGILICNIPRIVAGATATITTTMNGVVKGVRTNRVSVESDETVAGFDILPGNNSTTQATTVRTRADVQVVSKIASSASIAVRRPYTWTLKVRNNAGAGLAEADSVIVTDNLPATMELTGTPTVAIVAGTTTSTTCTGTAGQTSFTCDLGSLSSAGEVDITIPVRNLTVPAGGTSTNSATVTTSSQDVVPANNTNSGAVTVTSSSIAGLVFRDFNNNGANDAGDTGIASITMTLAGTAFDGSAVSRSTTTSAGTFTFATLPEGTYTITRGAVTEAFLTLGQQTAGTSGGVATTPPNISGISLGENISATAYLFAYVPRARMGVSKRVIGSPTSNPDGSLTAVLRVGVRNYSLEGLSSITLDDQLTGAAPRFGNFVAGGAAATLSAGNYTINAAPSVNGSCATSAPDASFDGDVNLHLATIGTLASNASCEFNVTLRYKPTVPLPPGNYTNQASGTATGALSGQTPTDLSENGANADPDGDNDPTNNNTPTPLGAVLVADVSTTVTLPASAAAGSTVAGTVLYKNLGPYTANATTFAMTLSTGLTGVTFGNLPAGATASYNPATGAVTLGGMPTSLASGAIASGDGTNPIDVTYTQNAVANTSLASGIATTSNEGANVGPNASNATVTGPLIADVTTSLAFPASADAGTPVSGTVVYRNTGPSIASGMTFTLTLSSSLTGVSFSNLPVGAAASYNSGTGVVTFTGMPATLGVGAIASGNGTTGIVVNYTQPGTATSSVISGIGTSTSQGANVAPDAANTTLTGSLIADVTTSLAFPVSVNAGQPVSGTILFSNTGPSIASGMTYAMTLTPGLSGVVFSNLPAGATASYNSSTGAVTFASMPGTLGVGAIASGNGTTGIGLTYTQPGTALSSITSTIGTSTNQGANVALDNASASPGGGLIADVRARVTFPATVDAGQPVSGSAFFSNNGPSIASGMSYSVTLSTGLAGVTFGNLPLGATATYNSTTGVVSFAGMPATLGVGALASGNSTTGITIDYVQNAVANSTVLATIGTSTSQGANIAPDTDNATITGALIVDVTTALQNFPAVVNPGLIVSGKVLFRNAGPSAASGMTYAITLTRSLTGVTLGNLPAGATATYSSTTGVVTLAGMPLTLAPNAIASGDGTNPITLSYTQIVSPSTKVASAIGTSTSQGANLLPDTASTLIVGLIENDLAVVKTTTASAVAPGDTITYRIRVTNRGAFPLPAGSTLVDPVTPGLTLLSAICSNASGNQCVTAPTIAQLTGTTSFVLPALIEGLSYELLVNAVVTATSGANISNTARVAVPPGYQDPDPTNDRSTAGPTTVRALPDLALTKTAATPLTLGGTASYLLSVRNIGAAATTGTITLADNLPAGLTFVRATGASWSCAATGQAVSCTNPGPLASGATTSVSLDVAVAATLQSSITNTASVSTPGDPRASNDTSSVTTPVVSGADLALVKSVNSDTLHVGTPAVYTLTVTNRGGSPTTGNIQVIDDLNAALSATSASGPGFTCTIAGQRVTCSRSTPLVANESVDISINVTVALTAPIGTLANSACVKTAGDVNTANDCGTIDRPVRGGKSAELTKELTSPLSFGAPATYRLVLHNRGTAPLDAPVTVVDTMPNALTLLNAAGNGWSCQKSGDIATCALTSPLAVGDSAAFTVTATLKSNTSAEVTNCAVLAPSSTTSYVNGGRACVTGKPQSLPDIETKKSIATDTLRVGGEAPYNITITNRGGAATSAPIVLADTLPSSLTPNSALGTDFTCTVAGQIVSCSRSTPLAAGASVTVTIAATVRSDAALTPITNNACAHTALDANAVNDCSSVTTPVAGRLEASLTKRAVGDFVVGQVGSFVLSVRNTGSVAIPAPISITDSLPRGLTYSSALGDGWSCSAAANIVNCTRQTALAASDSASLTIKATVDAAALPEVTNCAVLHAPTGTTLAANGRACATVKPTTDYRLVLELTTPRYEREVRDVPDFTVVVRNVGKSPLPDVIVSNILPRGFSYVAGSSARGGRPDLDTRRPITDPTLNGTSISWPIGSMTPGQVVRIDYRALIHTGASFNVDNITTSAAASAFAGLRVTSNTATVPIRIRRGLFDDRGVIAGKVYVDCNCDHSLGQGSGEVGIPGVRVLLEDGTGAITDAEGKYNIENVRSGLHVVKVDRGTLPAGAKLVTLNTRNAGDAASRFVDLKSGELSRADFAEGSHSPEVFNAVIQRRRLGEIPTLGDSLALSRMLATQLSLTSGSTALRAPLAPSLLSKYEPLQIIGSTMSPSARTTENIALHDGNSALPPTLQRARVQLVTPNDSTLRADSPAATVTLGATTDAPTLAVSPAPRPFLAAGLLQARIDFRSINRGGIDLTRGADAFEDQLNSFASSSDSGRTHAGARGAILLKGQVKNAGYLTLAYDSERDRDRTQFRDITPDQGYPLFGDASLREFDAQSQEHLYARLDRGSSWLRYGDFTTSHTDERRMLLAYDRSLTGLTYHVEGRRALAETFASRNGIRQFLDEIRGRGLSGPYFLTHANAVVNSERVEIVTRDRNQPAVVLRTQSMVRFDDYTLDATSGRLLFRTPVASIDESLNPVSIRVSYEVEQGGDRYYTYGGDGRLRVGDRLELGAFAVHDANPLDKQSLLGVSATALLGRSTQLLSELAHTETGSSSLGGTAWRVELRHESTKVEGRIFALSSDTGFVNRSSTFTGGRAEYGTRWTWKLEPRTRLIAEALHTEDTRTDGSRDGASLSIERRLTKQLVAEVGYRYAHENGATVTPVFGSTSGIFGDSVTNNTRGLAPLSFSAARARLTAQLPGTNRSSLFAEYELGVNDAGIRRGTIGGQYLLFDRARLYLRHEWISSTEGPYALANGRHQENTVFGIDADYLRNGQLFSEYRARDAFSGRDAEASIGLRNRWMLAKGIVANTSFERVSPLAGTATGAVFATTGAIEWTRSALWKGTARLEWRESPTGNDLLGSLGYARKLSRDWTVLGRSLWDQLNTDQLRARSQLAFAWRQTDRNTINALFRFENHLDRNDAAGAPTTRSIANVAAALVNIQPTPTLTISARYAGKVADDRRDAVSTRSTAQLLMARTILDFSPRFDGGIIGSVLGNGSFGERRYGVGGEVGVIVMRNLRLAGGYNLFGFTDRDFSSLGYTQRGPYVELGFKFDEELFKKSGSK